MNKTHSETFTVRGSECDLYGRMRLDALFLSMQEVGERHACELGAESGRQWYTPAGFAHGFCVLSEEAEFHYKCSEFFDPKDDRGLPWDDPAIGVAWPVEHPILSKKDTLRIPFDRLREADFPHVTL